MSKGDAVLQNSDEIQCEGYTPKPKILLVNYENRHIPTLFMK